jgi:hypothetical protein
VRDRWRALAGRRDFLEDEGLRQDEEDAHRDGRGLEDQSGVLLSRQSCLPDGGTVTIDMVAGGQKIWWSLAPFRS